MSEYGWIQKSLSAPRFEPYLQVCSGDYDLAVRLYWWNLEVSAGFYAPLHCLELALRNAAHDELSRRYGRSDWWAVCTLVGAGPQLVEDAIRNCRRTLGHEPSADDVVTTLSFGFWVSLLSRSNDEAIWRPALHRVFRPGYRGPRRVLHEHFEHLRRFRNRIMHHEPIYLRSLQSDRIRIYELIGYLSPALATDLERNDSLPGIMSHRPLPVPGEGS